METHYILPSSYKIDGVLKGGDQIVSLGTQA